MKGHNVESWLFLKSQSIIYNISACPSHYRDKTMAQEAKTSRQPWSIFSFSRKIGIADRTELNSCLVSVNRILLPLKIPQASSQLCSFTFTWPAGAWALALILVYENRVQGHQPGSVDGAGFPALCLQLTHVSPRRPPSVEEPAVWRKLLRETAWAHTYSQCDPGWWWSDFSECQCPSYRLMMMVKVPALCGLCDL